MATILCKDLATAAAAASSTDHLTGMVFFYRMLVSKVWTVSECSCDDDDDAFYIMIVWIMMMMMLVWMMMMMLMMMK